MHLFSELQSCKSVWVGLGDWQLQPRSWRACICVIMSAHCFCPAKLFWGLVSPNPRTCCRNGEPHLTFTLATCLAKGISHLILLIGFWQIKKWKDFRSPDGKFVSPQMSHVEIPTPKMTVLAGDLGRDQVMRVEPLWKTPQNAPVPLPCEGTARRWPSRSRLRNGEEWILLFVSCPVWVLRYRSLNRLKHHFKMVVRALEIPFQL